MREINRWWFEKTYNDLIESRKYRGTKRKRNDGLNKHHIIPKCLGGKDEEDNYVLLTFREHIIAHMLLYKLYPNKSKLAYALLRMIQSSKSDRKENQYKLNKLGQPIKFSTRYYEDLRIKSIEYLKEINTGKKHSKETIEKIRKAKTGVKYSDETRKLLSEMRKGHLVSKDTREKISKSRKGIIFTEEHKAKLSIVGKNRKKATLETRNKIKENITTTRKVVGPDGTIYKTIKQCANIVGVSITTLKKWIKNKPDKGYHFDVEFISNEERLSKISYKVQGPDGTIYSSIRECSRQIGRSRHSIKRWAENNENGFKYI